VAPLKDSPRTPDADLGAWKPGRVVMVRSSDERVGVGLPARWVVRGRGASTERGDRCAPAAALAAAACASAGRTVLRSGPSARVMSGAVGVAVPAGAEVSARDTPVGSGVEGGI
jgi:hypothetical protein